LSDPGALSLAERDSLERGELSEPLRYCNPGGELELDGIKRYSSSADGETRCGCYELKRCKRRAWTMVRRK
jgi:hypothetical protein